MRFQLLVLFFMLAAIALPECSAPDNTVDASGGSGGGGGGFAFDGGHVIDGCSGPDAAAGADADADADADASDARACTASRTDVHFARDVRPILVGCAGEICHSYQWGSQHPWATMVGVTALECCDGRKIVAPGDPANSYLLQKLENHDICEGKRMPLQQTPLDAQDLQTIADWICLGAAND